MPSRCGRWSRRFRSSDARVGNTGMSEEHRGIHPQSPNMAQAFDLNVGADLFRESFRGVNPLPQVQRESFREVNPLPQVQRESFRGANPLHKCNARAFAG